MQLQNKTHPGTADWRQIKTERLASLTSHISPPVPVWCSPGIKRISPYSLNKGRGTHHCLSIPFCHTRLLTCSFLQHQGVGFLAEMQLATAETQEEEGAMQGNYTRTKKMLITQWRREFPAQRPFIWATVTSLCDLFCVLWHLFFFVIFMTVNLPLLICTFTVVLIFLERKTIWN